MKLKIENNKYGTPVVPCPFCDWYHYPKDNVIKWMLKHFVREARKEALIKLCNEETVEKHLDYVIKHSKPKLVLKSKERAFDDNLKLE